MSQGIVMSIEKKQDHFLVYHKNSFIDVLTESQQTLTLFTTSKTLQNRKTRCKIRLMFTRASCPVFPC